MAGWMEGRMEGGAKEESEGGRGKVMGKLTFDTSTSRA